MSTRTAAKNLSDLADMTQFGIFYPVGYIVAGFMQASDAKKVQQNLMAGGYGEDDCLFYSAAEVADSASRNLEQHTSFLATLGSSDEAVRKHLDAAREGANFLLIYAPGDVEAERAMNVVRRVPFAFAHRYHRLAIEELK
jgi:20S proteasome alpha/beta subunit